MAVQRPPDLSCTNYAALAPGLEAIAEHADTALQGMSSSTIDASMDRAVFLKTIFTGGGQPTQPAGTFALNTTIELPNTNPARWYYAGWWIALAGRAAGTNLRSKIIAPNRNFYTGAPNNQEFVRTYRITGTGTTGDDVLWQEVFFPSQGGQIWFMWSDQTAGTTSINSGYCWAIQLGSKPA